MRAPSTGQASIWSAALAAVNCRAVGPQGRQHPIRWQRRRDSMRYVARRDVEVHPLGVRLGAGDVLEVRWDANETGYTLAVRSGQ